MRRIVNFYIHIIQIKWWDWLIIVAVFCIAVWIARELIVDKKITKKQGIAGALLVLHITIFLMATVFGRVTNTFYYDYQFNITLLWKIRLMLEGNFTYFGEVTMNIAVMMPVGFLIPIIKKKHPLATTVLVGVICSIVVETLQYLLKRGTCEIDDIINNTIGVLAGYGLYRILILIKRKLQKKNS